MSDLRESLVYLVLCKMFLFQLQRVEPDHT